MLMNYRELSQMYRTLGPRQTCQRITEALQAGRRGETGGLRASDFSLRQVAESVVENGREWVQSMDPAGGRSVLESSDAVDSTAFSNITGQLLISEIMEGYQSAEFAISSRIRSVPTRLSGERIPGLGNIGDKAESVKEGMPFPHVGFGEDYVDTPQTDKKGLIVPITKEAIFFDRTGLILERGRDVGESLGINKEKRCIDELIGTTNTYKWKGTTYQTYQAGPAPWANTLTGAAFDLVDWNQVDEADQLFNELEDPNTGEPVVVNPNTIIATPAKNKAVNRILTATEVREKTNGGNTETVSSNPVAANYTGFTSRYLYSRLKASGLTAAQAKKVWFLGDLGRAFRYMENWPITVVQAPMNSEAEFNQDIVARFKASERGVMTTRNPRFMSRISGF